MHDGYDGCAHIHSHTAHDRVELVTHVNLLVFKDRVIAVHDICGRCFRSGNGLDAPQCLSSEA